MSKMSARKISRKTLTAMLSILTIGAALSMGVGKAVAADDVTEDQILRALVPPPPILAMCARIPSFSAARARVLLPARLAAAASLHFISWYVIT